MRDFQLQTPQRDQTSANRRSKSTPDLNKNLRKVTKKSLNPAFKAVSEDDSAVLESLKEFSEALDDNTFGESAENFFDSVNPVETHSSETVAMSDLTSSSLSSSTLPISDKQVAIYDANTKDPEVGSVNKIGSIEAEVVIKHLREARVQVLKSKDMGPSKKLLEALINIIIEEFHGGLYENNEWLDKLLSRKSNLVVLSFAMGIIAVLIFWFFSLSSKESLTRETPT